MPLTGSENANKQAFDRASALLASTIHVEYPSVTQVLQQFDHCVEIDTWTEYKLFPSNNDDLPLGLCIQAWNRGGSGLDSTTMVGLFADWSAVYAVIKYGLAQHGAKPWMETRIVTSPDYVQRGDLIVDLGFTVETVDRQPHGTYLRDGEREIFVRRGYEFEVNRCWPGRDEFLANS